MISLNKIVLNTKTVNTIQIAIVCLILIAIALGNYAYYQHYSGHLTWDSAHYLELAQSIADGKGTQTYTEFIYPIERERHVTLWPVAYPGLLAIFKLILPSISIDIVSKILNVFLAFLLVLLFRWYYKRQATPFYFLLLNAIVFLVYTHTLSESLFIPAGLLYVMSFQAFGEHRISGSRFLFLSFISFAILFSTRYAGLFLLAVPVFIQLKSLLQKNNLKPFINYAFLVNIVSALLYMSFNYWLDGNLTGPERPPNRLGIDEIGVQFLQVLPSIFHFVYAELTYALSWDLYFNSLGLFLFFIFLGKKLNKYLKKEEVSFKLNYYFVAGIAYLAGLFIYKLFIDIDKFNFRLIAPAVFFLWCGLVHHILVNYKKSMLMAMVLSYMAIISIGYNLWYLGLEKKAEANYEKEKHDLLAKTDHLPEQFLLFNGDFRLFYLRPGSAVFEPNDDFIYINGPLNFEKLGRHTAFYQGRRFWQIPPKNKVLKEAYKEDILQFLDTAKKDSIYKLEDIFNNQKP